MKRRILASLLSLVMMLSLLPTAVWAVNDEGAPRQVMAGLQEQRELPLRRSSTAQKITRKTQPM